MGNSAGRLAFGIIGGVIGAFTPIGFAGGFMIGSLIGAIVFPVAGPTIEGSRLSDTTVSSSAHGSPIPLGYGTMRMPAHVIDATDIVEERTEEDVGGGKGGMMGGGATQVTYKYFANLMLSFGSHLKMSLHGGQAVGVVKFFADGKLAWDDSATALTLHEIFTGGFGKNPSPGFEFRFYPGDEAQLPDPFFEGLRGVGNVSAYREQVCLALEHWALEDYGNRIPFLTAIIAFEGNTSAPLRSELSFAGRDMGNAGTGFSFDQMTAVASNVGVGASGDDPLSRIDLTTLTEIQRGPDFTAFGRPDGEGDVTQILVAPLSGRIVGIGASGPGFGTNAHAIHSIDPDTLQGNGKLGQNSANVSTVAPASNTDIGNVGARGAGFAINDALLIDNTIQTFVAHGNAEQLGIFEVLAPEGPGSLETPNTGHIQWVWGGNATDGLGKLNFGSEGWWSAIGPGQISIGATQFIGATRWSGSNSGSLYLITIGAGSAMDVSENSQGGVSIAPIVNNLGLADDDERVQGIAYDRTDETVILIYARNVSNDVKIEKRDSISGSLVWTTDWMTDRNTPWTWLQGANMTAFGQSRIATSTFCLHSAGTGHYEVNGVTGEVGPVIAGGVTANSGAIDSVTRSFFNSSNDSGLEQRFCGRIEGLGESLQSINEYVAQRLGYDISDPNEVNFTALNGITVPGGIISRQQVAQAPMREWTQAYNYDVIEADQGAVATFLDKAPVETIAESDLMILSDKDGNLITEARVEDFEIPARVNIIYADPSHDYLPGLQREQRLLHPRPSVRSQTEVQIELPFALNATEAREIAERLLYRGWVERRTVTFKTTWKYIYLTPGDIVDLDLTSLNLTLRVRIVEIAIGADSVMECSAVTHASPLYTPSAVVDNTDAGDGFDNTLPESGVARVEFLDYAPLLRDADNSFTTVPTYFGCSATPGFVSSTLYKREPAGSWEAIDRCVREVVKGVTSGALPAPAFGAFVPDEDSSITLVLTEGSDSTIVTQTDAQWKSNGLAFLVGREVISVRTVVDNGDNSFTVSGLYRGLLGTEQFTDTHAASEQWFLLDSSFLMALQDSLDSLNVAELWKAVADGQSFDLAIPFSHTNSGVPSTPFSVSELGAVNSGNDIVISWMPRSRLTSNMRDGVDGYIESEQTESYEIDILQNGVLIRTLTSTDGTVTYTFAQQVTDFGGAVGDVEIDVYKMSNIVGRGYPASITHTGAGQTVVTRPAIVGTVTEHNKHGNAANLETFNVTPAAGDGRTMQCVWVTYMADGPIADDDLRFLEMQGGSSVTFNGEEMQHFPYLCQFNEDASTFLGDLFYVIDPGTALSTVNIIFPDGLIPDSMIVASFTVENVNPTTPFSIAKDRFTGPASEISSPPTWPTGNTGSKIFDDEGNIHIEWWKHTDNPTLGLFLQAQQDPRKLIDFHGGVNFTAVDFGTATGNTTGNNDAIGYRIGSQDLDGVAGTTIQDSYNTQEYNTTQPRESDALLIEVNGV